MSNSFEVSRPLPGARFGGTLRLADAAHSNARDVITATEASPEALSDALAQCDGLLLLTGMQAIADEPALLVRLSRLFGPEVEDYRQTLTRSNMVHESVPEIFVVSNIPSVGRQPPPRPDRRSPPMVSFRRNTHSARAGTPTRAIAGRRRIFRCSLPLLQSRRARDRRCSRMAPRRMTLSHRRSDNASTG